MKEASLQLSPGKAGLCCINCRQLEIHHHCSDVVPKLRYNCENMVPHSTVQSGGLAGHHHEYSWKSLRTEKKFMKLYLD